MLITGSIVAFAFRLINLAALIGVMIYLIKKYALPDLNQSIIEKEASVQSVIDQTHHLHEKAHHLDADFKNQEHLAHELIRKVHAWKTQFEAQVNQREQERHERIEAAQEKVAIQQQMIKQMHLQNKVLPIAVEHAQKTLEQQFSNEQAGKDYISSIFSAIERARK